MEDAPGLYKDVLFGLRAADGAQAIYCGSFLAVGALGECGRRTTPAPTGSPDIRRGAGLNPGGTKIRRFLCCINRRCKI
jgi:hypothetical protein